MQTALWKGQAFCFAVRWRCVCCSLAWFQKRPPPSFLSESLWLSIERAFKFKGLLYFIFRLRLHFKWDIPISGFATMTSRANKILSRCATTWLPTSPSGGYSAAPLPSSPESGLTSHCESDKLSLLSLVRMTLTRNNHRERGLGQVVKALCRQRPTAVRSKGKYLDDTHRITQTTNATDEISSINL